MSKTPGDEVRELLAELVQLIDREAECFSRCERCGHQEDESMKGTDFWFFVGKLRPRILAALTPMSSGDCGAGWREDVSRLRSDWVHDAAIHRMNQNRDLAFQDALDAASRAFDAQYPALSSPAPKEAPDE